MSKTALVFGHTSGLGKAIVARLIDDGYAVVGVARTAGVSQSPQLIGIKADLTSRDDVERVTNEIITQYPVFDVLVYAAGALTSHALDDLDYDAAERMFRLHALAPMYIESHLLDRIKENKTYVVNITSSTLIFNYPQFAEYASSKAALAKFTKDLQKELQDTGARVMDICPAGFASSIFRTMTGDKKDRDESVQMDPDDIAGLIGYIIKLPRNIEIPYLFVNRKNV